MIHIIFGVAYLLINAYSSYGQTCCSSTCGESDYPCFQPNTYFVHNAKLLTCSQICENQGMTCGSIHLQNITTAAQLQTIVSSSGNNLICSSVTPSTLMIRYNSFDSACYVASGQENYWCLAYDQFITNTFRFVCYCNNSVSTISPSSSNIPVTSSSHNGDDDDYFVDDDYNIEPVVSTTIRAAPTVAASVIGSSKSDSLSTGAIIGIAIGSAAGVIIVIVLLYKFVF